jgi:LmbE family N-acetylglucosaminyl deacetylase
MFVQFVKNKKFWLIGIAGALLLGWGSGFLTGWWRAKGTIALFPKVDNQTRLLVIAPHPDDEVLIAGGLIQKTLEAGGKVKILFLTNGDGSRGTVLREAKKADFSPQEYLNLGEQRMGEAVRADAVLGVKKENLVFLGFPDRGLEKPGTSPATKFNHVPYEGTLHPGQVYSTENLLSDIKEVANAFKPTLVATTHLRDLHPDHRTAFLLTQRLRFEGKENWPICAAVVHFRGYPAKGEYLIPPKKLFGSDWLSLILTEGQRQKKLEAVKEHKSQFANYEDKVLFARMSARNEIFEKE